jgi:DNA-binding response OmpR family regulator
MKILLVEDEKYIAEAIAALLKKNKYSVDIANDGEDGLNCALDGIYDIIVLDIILPKMDGVTVLRELRTAGIQSPVLMLTSKDKVQDKINGLDAGADDYLVKPVDFNELLARLRALGRRHAELLPDGILQYAGLEYNPHTLIVAVDTGNAKLTPKEGQILELLIKNKDIAISKDTIIEKLWGFETEAEDSHVEIHMSNLRKKLQTLAASCVIETIRGVGYVLRFNKP